MAASGSQESAEVVLDIKNPSRNLSNFTLTVTIGSSVGRVKQLLSEQYDGRPPPHMQTLIYAGKVLKNEARLNEILPQPWDCSSPHSLHLVVKQPDVPTTSAPITSATPSLPSAQLNSGSNQRQQSSSPNASGIAPPQAESSAAGPSPSSNDAGPSSSGLAPTFQPQYCPLFFVNPVLAAAYQAAYAAALAAAAKMQHLQGFPGQQQNNPNQLLPPFSPYAVYYAPYNANYNASTTSSNFQGQQTTPVFAAYAQMAPAPFPLGFVPLGVPPVQYPGLPQFQMQPHGFPGQFRQVEHNRQNVRFAFPEGARYRRRVLSFRISLRTLLQFIVFAVVFYKQVSLTRFLVLFVGGLVLFLTANYPPLRRLVSGMGQAATPENNTQPIQRRGILWEIGIVVLGFITSLIPAWNYNANDAAAFQAAQDILAQDDDNGDNRNPMQPNQGPANGGQEPQQQEPAN